MRRQCMALVLGLSLLLVAASSGWAQQAGPDEVIERGADRLLELIERHGDDYEDNPEPFFEAVDESMAGFVDYGSFARGVMARHWSEASKAQRERFTKVLRDGLVRSYATAMVGFELSSVEVRPLQDNHVRGDRAIVRMDVTTAGGDDYTLQYAMARSDEHGWRVRNVEVMGVVDLGRAYRSQFSSAMRSEGSIADVIDAWSSEPPDELSDAEMDADNQG